MVGVGAEDVLGFLLLARGDFVGFFFLFEGIFLFGLEKNILFKMRTIHDYNVFIYFYFMLILTNLYPI